MLSSVDYIAGETFHGRRGAVENAFRYTIDCVMLDAEADDLIAPALFGRNKGNLAALRDLDHGGAPKKGEGAIWARAVLAAHGLAGCIDAVGIDVEPRGVGAQEADGGLGILHRRRELVFGAQAIVDVRRNVAVLGEIVGDGPVALARAGAEPAAVDADDRRKRAIAGFRACHVEQLLAADGGVLNPLFEEDVVRRVLG